MDATVKGSHIAGEAQFDPDRVFYIYGADAPVGEGWYFFAREGVIGPYELRSIAERMLEAYVKFCVYCPERGRCSGHPEQCSLRCEDTPST